MILAWLVLAFGEHLRKNQILPGSLEKNQILPGKPFQYVNYTHTSGKNTTALLFEYKIRSSINFALCIVGLEDPTWSN